MPSRKPIATVRPPNSVYVLGRITKNPWIAGGFNKKLLRQEVKQRTIIPIKGTILERQLRKKGIKTSNLVFYPRQLPSKDYGVHERSVHTEPQKRNEPSFVFKGTGGELSYREHENIEERKFHGGARKTTINQAIFVAKNLWKAYNKALKEKDPVVMEAVKYGIKEAPFLQPITTIEPKQLPFQLKDAEERKAFLEKHKKSLLPKEIKLLKKPINFAPENLLAAGKRIESTKIFKLVNGSRYYGIPKKLRKQEIVLNYAIPLNTRIEELRYGLSPLKKENFLKWQKVFEHFGYELQDKAGKSIVKKGKQIYNLFESPEIKQDILNKFAVSLALSTHIIQNRLKGSVEAKHGRVFDDHNTTILGHIVDYDTIGINERISRDKKNIQRGNARRVIRIFGGLFDPGIVPLQINMACNLYDSLLKKGDEYIQAKRKRKR